MYKKITVIGLGSLGGFFASYISDLEGLELLSLIDSDSVEMKNLENSIYRECDVYKKKVHSLREIIQFNKPKLQIYIFDHNFQEGSTKLPESDLVVDCRDSVCNRGNKIDIRLSISYRSLIIDCKKNVVVERERKGRYISSVTKNDIRSAAFTAFRVIDSGLIKDMIQRQLVHYVELDRNEDDIERSIQLKDNKPEMLYDYCDGENKLVNLHERLPSVIEANKESELRVVIGESRRLPQPIDVIPKHQLQTFNDGIRVFSTLVRELTLPFDRYYMEMRAVKGKIYIELYPETGGA